MNKKNNLEQTKRIFEGRRCIQQTTREDDYNNNNQQQE